MFLLTHSHGVIIIPSQVQFLHHHFSFNLPTEYLLYMSELLDLLSTKYSSLRIIDHLEDWQGQAKTVSRSHDRNAKL